MSRIGRMPITIPEGVEVKQNDKTLSAKGKNGTLSLEVHPDMTVEIDGPTITVSRPSDLKYHKALHGLTRSLINNMVIGVSEGFSKTLEINGIGYRAAKNGNKVSLNLGLSHPVEVEEPEGIELEVPAQNRIIVKGADKQLVGETAARIRKLRLPDPYKGKGIKYATEVLRLKEGKTGARS